LQRILIVLGSGALLMGATMAFAFALIGSEVGEDGVLDEPFYLVGIGMPLILLGGVMLSGVLLFRLFSVARRKSRN